MEVFRFQKGDNEHRKKLEKIYLDYRNKMYYWAVSIVKDQFIAEDIVHNVILSLSRKGVLDRVDEIGDTGTNAYLATITRNTAYNWYNREKREKSLLESLTAICGASEASHNDIDDLVEKMNMEDIIACIKKISDAEVNILTLRYVDQLSNKEIAEELKISEPAVRKRIERAKLKLRNQLQNNINADELPFGSHTHEALGNGE